jgi:hypothetical protein
MGEHWQISMFGVWISVDFDTLRTVGTHGNHDGIGSHRSEKPKS